MAALNAFSAHIRLTIPEAFAVHNATIDWDATTSEDRMPGTALGAPWFFVPVMRSAMASWERVDFFNRYLAGTVMPRLFLDVASRVDLQRAFRADRAQDDAKLPSDYVAAGRATQRFWLTATRLGFQVQPLYTPLVFSPSSRGSSAISPTSKRRRHGRRDVAARLEGDLRRGVGAAGGVSRAHRPDEERQGPVGPETALAADRDDGAEDDLSTGVESLPAR